MQIRCFSEIFSFTPKDTFLNTRLLFLNWGKSISFCYCRTCLLFAPYKLSGQRSDWCHGKVVIYAFSFFKEYQPFFVLTYYPSSSLFKCGRVKKEKKKKVLLCQNVFLIIRTNVHRALVPPCGCQW